MPENDEVVELTVAEYERLTSEADSAARAQAEADTLKPMALRESIRTAGFDPDSSAGRVLAELAGADPTLSSASALSRKAGELGLESGEPPVPTNPGQGGEAVDFTAGWPPDDIALRVHRRNAALAAMARDAELQGEISRAEREERNRVLTEYGRQIVSEGTGGWSGEQAEALAEAAESGDYMAQITRAREDGDYPLASALQLQAERAQAGKAGAR